MKSKRLHKSYADNIDRRCVTIQKGRTVYVHLVESFSVGLNRL